MWRDIYVCVSLLLEAGLIQLGYSSAKERSEKSEVVQIPAIRAGWGVQIPSPADAFPPSPEPPPPRAESGHAASTSLISGSAAAAGVGGGGGSNFDNLIKQQGAKYAPNREDNEMELDAFWLERGVKVWPANITRHFIQLTLNPRLRLRGEDMREHKRTGQGGVGRRERG